MSACSPRIQQSHGLPWENTPCVSKRGSLRFGAVVKERGSDWASPHKHNLSESLLCTFQNNVLLKAKSPHPKIRTRISPESAISMTVASSQLFTVSLTSSHCPTKNLRVTGGSGLSSFSSSDSLSAPSVLPWWRRSQSKVPSLGVQG